MTITFERPIGAPADLKELEYIAALHQTCFPNRRDGSISATDIVRYLNSRHGIVVDEDVVKQHILVDLSGELELEPAYKLDLVELMALLLIPYLLRDDKSTEMALSQVLDVILHETDSCQLNREFLKTVLDFHGEVEVDEHVLDGMMEAAGGEGEVLNVKSLKQALTSDVTNYRTEWTDSLTTHYQDVFNDQNKAARNNDEEDPQKDTVNDTLAFQKVWTAPAIDFVADTYRSQTYTVMLWLTLVMVYLSYFWNFDVKWGQVPCDRLGEFGCKIINGITRWIVIFLELSILGTAFIFFASAGNSLFEHKPLAFFRLVIGMTTIVLATIVSVFVTVDSQVISTKKDGDFYAIYWTTFVLGCVLLFLQVLSLIRLFFSGNFLKRFKPLEIFLTPGMDTMELRTKIAAHVKVSAIVENALNLHDSSILEKPDSSSHRMTALGKALLNFQIHPEETERVGGVWWAWKRVWDRSIFQDEGVWLHSRLVACTMAQLFICILLIVSWQILFRAALAEVQGSSWDSALVSSYVYVWEVVVGATAGIIAGLFASLSITIIYIPSYISTVLKFRRGVLPSLKDNKFIIYRYSAEQATVLFGSSLWGCFFTGATAATIVGGLVFLIVWHVTRSVLFTIIAQLIGMGTMYLLRVLVLLFLRRKYCAAYYRMETMKDNFMNLILECWNLGITSGFMLVRACKLFFLTACYLGRLDTPMLADGVGVLNLGIVKNIALDSYPIAFRKDLLSHDAHRHPLLERLGTMYMMKLRYGDDFGRRSGSCWRVLFVLCLMPWMRKYRLRSISSMDELDEQIKQVESDLKEEKGEEEAVPDKTLDRQETMRKLNRLKNLRDLTQLDGITSHEEYLERQVELLRARNEQLLNDNKKLHWMITGDISKEYYAGMSLQMSSDAGVKEPKRPQKTKRPSSNGTSNTVECEHPRI